MIDFSHHLGWLYLLGVFSGFAKGWYLRDAYRVLIQRRPL